MTNLAHLRSGPERATVADIDHARNAAIRALDALRDLTDMEAADYWVGYLSNVPESVIYKLRAGA